MSSSAPVVRHRIFRGCSRGGILRTDPKALIAEYARSPRNSFPESLRALSSQRLNALVGSPQALHLPPDFGILAYQNREIRPVDQPGRDVSGVEVTHRDPSSSDSSACASSISRFTTSRR